VSVDFGAMLAGSAIGPNFRDWGQWVRRLGYVGLTYDRNMIVKCRGLDVRVAEPEAFVLLKVSVIPRARGSTKTKKDIETARILGSFLGAEEENRRPMEDIFDKLPNGRKQTARRNASEHTPLLWRAVLEG